MNLLNKLKSKLLLSKKKVENKAFDEFYSDLGVFQYIEDGFHIEYKDFNLEIKWSEITQINVFKMDLITTDSITMEIKYNDRSITISEEIPGWYQFVLNLKAEFPIIPKDWNIQIIKPAFTKNYRTIFEKSFLY